MTDFSNFSWNSRKYLRVPIRAPAAIRINRSFKSVVQMKEKTVLVKLIDLSEGGCALESPCFFPPGVRLNVFLERGQFLPPDAPHKAVRTTRITGLLKTSRQLPGHQFRFGIQFIKISAEDRRIIREFVRLYERRRTPRVSFVEHPDHETA